MADVEVKRGYVLLPDNTVQFGIRVINNSEAVIIDVEVILDYPESLFKLQGDRIQKLGNIPPTIPRTAKFFLKPMGCVHNEHIEATIKYGDYKNEMRMLSMRPKEIHCVYPFLRSKPMGTGEFLNLSSQGYMAEIGINFEGIGI